jgi:hypothetical protein
MTNPYRAMCAELAEELVNEYGYCTEWEEGLPLCGSMCSELLTRARALLAQPVAEGPKPVVDYSRVTEIATEAQIRSAAQYLVKKRNCDGDLISAIEYAIARWGRPTLQPVAVSERPWERDGWCDAEGRCYGWDGDYWWMVSNPGAADETITHWLPANALPTPEA